MIIKVNVGICDRCGTCIAVCKNDSISMQKDSVFIDRERCLHCGSCSNVCPVSALKMDE
jgi:NAD-dependent dihydropyrimidine dehydrogenase PreA subunit